MHQALVAVLVEVLQMEFYINELFFTVQNLLHPVMGFPMYPSIHLQMQRWPVGVP